MKANPNPIFILGLMPRSGTNFLSNLLQLHPDCAPADPVWEDFIVAHLDQLARFSATVTGEWDRDWNVDDQAFTDLDISLGNGLTGFLEDRCKSARVISKTPRVTNLDLFYRFFPESRLLILVRDGRSIVESGARTFSWSREAAIHSVAEAARAISEFSESQAADQTRYRILRYEDLWQDTEGQLRELFAFLELEPENYDWQTALALPVRGSSELKAREDSAVHWDPVERDPGFDPMSRFAEWSDAAHFRYNSVAGAVMERFGYRGKPVKAPTVLLQARNALLDAAWSFRVLLRPVYHYLRKR